MVNCLFKVRLKNVTLVCNDCYMYCYCIKTYAISIENKKDDVLKRLVI